MDGFFARVGRTRSAGRRQLRLEWLEPRTLLSAGGAEGGASEAAAPGQSAAATAFPLAPVPPWFETSTIGLYAPSTSTFYLRNTNAAGYADITFAYGPAGGGWIPVVGDWLGGNEDTIGLYDPATSVFYLRNSNTTGFADRSFQYGPAGAGWIPIVGDWNSDGMDTVGLYDPMASVFYLKNINQAGVADIVFPYGPAGGHWLPIVGDWNADLQDTIGLYDPTASMFSLRNTNNAGFADVAFVFGPAGGGWRPLTGDWDGNGTTTTGLYDPTPSTFYLKNTNSSGFADVAFNYGPIAGGWLPIAGHWKLPSPLQASDGPATAADEPALPTSELQPIVREAIARWTAAGLDAATSARLGQVEFAIGDLPGAYLGQAGANRILIDRDAAGHGWFIDATPERNEEFVFWHGDRQWQAVDSRAVDRIDLLSVVEHELGHIAGYNDLDALSDDVMSGALGVGTRRQPRGGQPAG